LSTVEFFLKIEEYQNILFTLKSQRFSPMACGRTLSEQSSLGQWKLRFIEPAFRLPLLAFRDTLDERLLASNLVRNLAAAKFFVRTGGEREVGDRQL
jgi:hypothetical protein